MPIIRVKFRDRPETQTSRFRHLDLYQEFIRLTNVVTYVDQNTPHIEETGCDFYGDIFFNLIGEVYFDACDRIVVENDGKAVVIFDREAI